MREYGQIQCSYWQKASEEGWSSDATLLGAYLMTGPHSNGIGCYRLPSGYVSDDLGWTQERVSETLSELFQKGFCKRFGTVVLMPNFLRWNPISNGNVAKARAQEFESIPSDEAKMAAAVVLLEFGNHWTKGFENRLETLSERLREGYGKQHPTQPNPIQTQTKEDAIASLSAESGDAGSADGDRRRADEAEDDDGQLPPGADDALTPNCPHQAIIDLYHRELPELAKVRTWDQDRQKFLRARWREDPDRQTLEWWENYFRYVRGCPFLMGKGGGDNPFFADLEWLIRPSNFRKVIEGRYARRAA